MFESLLTPEPRRELQSSVRLGLFRDRPVLDHRRATFQSVVVPAHIAAYAADGLWGFLRGIDAARFFYDPMTYWFLLPPRYWVRGSESAHGQDIGLPVPVGEIRPAFRSLFEAYGLLSAATSALSREAYQAEVVEKLAVRSLEFQRAGIEAKTEKAVSKYARLLGQDATTHGFAPDRLVAPYL